jgi:diguanylate cyclase (GGDEF)-like protein
MERVHAIKIYEHGFAHLEAGGVVIHHGRDEVDSGDGDASEQYLRMSRKLVNGMTLVLSASYDDIRQVRYDIAFKLLFAVLVLAALFSAIVIFVVRKIVDPLKKLTDASKKLSDGNYDVEIIHSDTYEIKLLSTAFENMTTHLREHEKHQRFLAYRDSLTGLRNTTAYKAWVTEFDKEIQSGDMAFGVIVLDVNNLKETNDRHGHDAGNKLIVTAARIISNTFKRSPVFRIGGDEFVVILRNADLENREELFVKFDSECANTFVKTDAADVVVSVAKGFSGYDPARDSQFADVFNRADEAMYRDKRSTKTAQL